MSMPSKEQFFSLFDNPQSESVRKIQSELSERRSDLVYEKDYFRVFCEVFCLNMDWKESILDFLECLSEHLGTDILQVTIDDDNESAEVHYRSNYSIFTSPELDDFDDTAETFVADIAKLQAMLEQDYIILMVNAHKYGVSDTLQFLIIPAELWQQAESHYGTQHVSANFLTYGSA
ncbi:hypothetical protein [Budvicia aquatica]|uniref:Uncharacterized protein n=2 Tax=Budvicia aquatica TaxID=82979 RepID=A0A2C6DQJ0_9GAMM|nr:hypothetical protein [Budvicia aquatica]PHI30602.1 hypothetical protein CRN84_15275 [Budvicia aquatica]